MGGNPGQARSATTGESASATAPGAGWMDVIPLKYVFSILEVLKTADWICAQHSLDEGSEYCRRKSSAALTTISS